MVLAAVGTITVFLGWVQVWSVLSGGLIDEFGFSPAWMSMAYSMFTLASFCMQNLAGQLQKRIPPRFIFWAAAVLVFAGWSLPGFVAHPGVVFVAIGFLAGGGQGLAYNTSLSVAQRWFPDRRGLASGVCLGGMGLAPLAFAPFASFLIQGFGVQVAFRVVGALIGGIVLLMSAFMRYPRDGQQLARGVVAEPAAARSARQSARSVLSSAKFWVMWVGMIGGAIPGTVLIAHLSEMARYDAHLDVGTAALLVSAMALVNFVGRIGLGTVSDRLGRYRTLVVSYAAALVGFAGFALAGGNAVLFVASLCAAALGYGGMMSTMVALCSDVFGEHDVGRNYAMLFSGFTSGAWVGPTVAALVYEATGTFFGAYLLCAAVSAIGLCAILVLRRMTR